MSEQSIIFQSEGRPDVTLECGDIRIDKLNRWDHGGYVQDSPVPPVLVGATASVRVVGAEVCPELADLEGRDVRISVRGGRLNGFAIGGRIDGLSWDRLDAVPWFGFDLDMPVHC